VVSRAKWSAIPLGTHVLIDGQVPGLIIAELPKRAGQTYVVRTHAFTRFIHENRITIVRAARASTKA
jgi:hypothetical protein